jgi:ElaB/YqjD/DUF883 family membrane-anchored ribosome-binding protein
MRAERRVERAGVTATAALQDLINGADELLQNLRRQKGAAVHGLRDRASGTIWAARKRMPNLRDAAGDSVDSSVGFMRREPWRVVALGALALLAFSVFSRRGREHSGPRSVN